MKNTPKSLLLAISEPEMAIYETLLENGLQNIQQLSTDTGIHRPTVYKTLGALTSKGFVSKVLQGKRVMYKAESPRRLEKIIKDKYETALEEVAYLAEQFETTPVKKPIVSYHHGRQGLKDVFTDHIFSLKKGDTYYRYSSSGAEARAKNLKLATPEYRKIRDDKQLQRLVITNEYTKGRKIDVLGREVKAVPKDFDLFEDNVTQVIYGNKVSIIDYNTETAIVIEHPTIANFQKKIFRLLFRKL